MAINIEYYAASYQGRQPTNNLSLRSPQLSCPLVVGDFILFGESNHIGQISTVFADLSLKVNCWLRVNEQLLAEEQARLGPINPNTHRRASDVPEVVRSNGFALIPHDSVNNHAFVMHIDTIHDGTYPVNGMSCAFCTRQSIFKVSSDVPGVLTKVSSTEHRPFSSSIFNHALQGGG